MIRLILPITNLPVAQGRLEKQGGPVYQDRRDVRPIVMEIAGSDLSVSMGILTF